MTNNIVGTWFIVMPLRTPFFPGLFHIGIKIHSDMVYIHKYEYFAPTLRQSRASNDTQNCRYLVYSDALKNFSKIHWPVFHYPLL